MEETRDTGFRRAMRTLTSAVTILHGARGAVTPLSLNPPVAELDEGIDWVVPLAG